MSIFDDSEADVWQLTASAVIKGESVITPEHLNSNERSDSTNLFINSSATSRFPVPIQLSSSFAGSSAPLSPFSINTSLARRVPCSPTSRR
jgi:hypothetical protein